MTARFAIRLDDACPTLKRSRWQRIEEMLDEHSVRPVVAVVPDNHDPVLKTDTPDPTFWSRVRSWRDKGWTIALHGYQHVLRSTMARQILPFYQHSEFSGLTYEEQADKIQAALTIFRREDVTPQVWIAPAHCFDHITLNVLRDQTDIRLISDGIALDAFSEYGFFWIPQQLWNFKPVPFGLWTICLHPNEMEEKAFSRFEYDLARYSGKVVTFDDSLKRERKRSFPDHLTKMLFWLRRRNFNAAFRREARPYDQRR